MKDEKTNNESQNTTPKTKIGQHEPHQKPGMNSNIHYVLETDQRINL